MFGKHKFGDIQLYVLRTEVYCDRMSKLKAIVKFQLHKSTCSAIMINEKTQNANRTTRFVCRYSSKNLCSFRSWSLTKHVIKLQQYDRIIINITNINIVKRNVDNVSTITKIS